MTAVWRITLILVAGLLGWRVLSLGLGSHYAEAGAAGDQAATQSALAWNPRQPTALAQHAAAAATAGERETSAAAWAELLRQDPPDHKALLGLAALTEDDAARDDLITKATSLNPTNPRVLKQAALHWVKREEPAKAMAAWSRAMEADPRETSELYPVLQRVFEDPRTRPLIEPYALKPPAWWDEFFRHIATTTVDAEQVRALFAARRAPGAAPLSVTERDAYIARLRKEGLSTEAYLVWVNGLDAAERQGLGLINNGGFENEPTGQGWDWVLRPNKNLIIETASTHGGEGRRALHLSFRGFDQPMGHVSQELFLESGWYRLSGRVRPNGLKTTGGLQWAIDCTDGIKTTRVATTERVLGASQWENFELEFEIPTQCARPILRLVGAVRTSTDRRIEGSIWYDALRIQRLPPRAAAG